MENKNGADSIINAFLRYTKAKSIPVKISTNMYCADILLLHVLHLPLKKSQLIIGTRSKAESVLLQEKHFDLPPKLLPVFILYKTTFKKLPIIEPKIKKAIVK